MTQLRIKRFFYIPAIIGFILLIIFSIVNIFKDDSIFFKIYTIITFTVAVLCAIVSLILLIIYFIEKKKN